MTDSNKRTTEKEKIQQRAVQIGSRLAIAISKSTAEYFACLYCFKKRSVELMLR
jgi:hypothetical protein